MEFPRSAEGGARLREGLGEVCGGSEKDWVIRQRLSGDDGTVANYGKISAMSRYGYYSCFPRQMTKWEKAEKAAKAIARMTKKGVALSPIPEFSGRIAKTFWGKAWCDNIESYRDYAYRLERGRSYVRSGAVIDLRIEKGRVAALVIGSGRSPYEVAIVIRPMAKAKWDELVKRSAGKIASLMALAQGKLPENLLADFCDPETGLFPKPSEISFDCSCPDGASCCKHVAAVLYGIGRKLDDEPTLFFTLRGIDPEKIIGADVVETLTDGTSSELEAENLGDVFGISLDAEVPTSTAAKRVHPATDGAELMKSTRRRLGLSQSAMSARLGTYQMMISQIERGKAVLRDEWRKMLAEMK